MKSRNQHILYWVIVFIILNLVFSTKWNSFSESFYFTSFLFPVAIGTAYFFNNVLIPKYLMPKKYLSFSIYGLYTLIISIAITEVIILGAFIILANFSWHSMDPIVKDVSYLVFLIYFIVIVFAFIQIYQSNLSNKAEIESLADKVSTSIKETIQVRSNRQTINIRIDEIDYIESLSDYVKIWNGDEPVITREKISHLEETLPDNFVRCHRSFIVNLNKIDSINYDQLFIKDLSIPVSRKYKDRLKV